MEVQVEVSENIFSDEIKVLEKLGRGSNRRSRTSWASPAR